MMLRLMSPVGQAGFRFFAGQTPPRRAKGPCIATQLPCRGRPGRATGSYRWIIATAMRMQPVQGSVKDAKRVAVATGPIKKAAVESFSRAASRCALPVAISRPSRSPAPPDDRLRLSSCSHSCSCRRPSKKRPGRRSPLPGPVLQAFTLGRRRMDKPPDPIFAACSRFLCSRAHIIENISAIRGYAGRRTGPAVRKKPVARRRDADLSPGMETRKGRICHLIDLTRPARSVSVALDSGQRETACLYPSPSSFQQSSKCESPGQQNKRAKARSAGCSRRSSMKWSAGSASLPT